MAEIRDALEPDGFEVYVLGDGDDLSELVRDACDRGCPTVGVAGGDGTVRVVADALAGGQVPMLVVPAGTRNHFARELGIETLEDVVAAANADRVRMVSVGRVNGQAFVNNASIGLYPALVRRRRRREHRHGKSLGGLIAAWELSRHSRPVQVAIGGDEMPAWLLFAGNGRYGTGFTDLVERDSLDSEVLDIRLVRADRRLSRTRVVLAAAAGRLDHTPLVFGQEVAGVTVGVAGRRVDVALDGEVVAMEAPLEFEVRPRHLAVLVPPAS